jgi:hypothetical protein
MAHFAKLDANNVVEQVIVVSNDDIKDNTGTEVESIGISFCQKLFGADTNWKQTSYNGSFRGNYAGPGATYMTNVETLGVASTDVFMSPSPYASWTVGVNTAVWTAPIEQPGLTTSQIAANQAYYWDEVAHQADTANPKTVGWALTTLSS